MGPCVQAPSLPVWAGFCAYFPVAAGVPACASLSRPVQPTPPRAEAGRSASRQAPSARRALLPGYKQLAL